MKIIIAPILLRRIASVKFPLIIEPGLSIKDFPIRTREEFFDIRNLKVNGHSVSYKPANSNEIFSHKAPFGLIGLDYLTLFRAESYIEIKGEDDVPTHILQPKLYLVNKALKILKSGSAGFLFAKFSGEVETKDWHQGAIITTGINPIYGGDYVLTKSDVQELKSIYRILSQRQNDEKTTMLVEKFVMAVSKNLRKHMRVLELFSILESLYLPEPAQGELSFRLSQRIAKLIYKRKRYEHYKEVRKLYIKRSILVHQSKDKFSDEEIKTLENITRTSLHLFLKEPMSFERNQLYKLFLQ